MSGRRWRRPGGTGGGRARDPEATPGARSYLRAAYAVALASKTDPAAPAALKTFGITANPLASIDARSQFNRTGHRHLSAASHPPEIRPARARARTAVDRDDLGGAWSSMPREVSLESRVTALGVHTTSSALGAVKMNDLGGTLKTSQLLGLRACLFATPRNSSAVRPSIGSTADDSAALSLEKSRHRRVTRRRGFALADPWGFGQS